jgi:hypothetical protein
MSNITQVYECNPCKYYTDKRSSYEKHILTWKHLKATDSSISKKTYECSNCLKKFKSKGGYTKHSKICGNTNLSSGINKEKIEKRENIDINSESSNNIQDYADEVMKSGNVTQELLVAIMKQMNETEKKHDEHMEKIQKQLEEERNQRKMLISTFNDNMTPRIGIYNNNQININVFLQERCKDALNLKDFVNSLRIELNDISNYQDHSMIDALGNVFVNGLRQLDLYKRPIHCTDLTRETLCIKDNDAWQVESGNKTKLHGAITAVAAKQSILLKEWEKENPNWTNDENLTSEYLRMVKTITNPIEKGSNDEKKLIHNIAKEVVVDLKQIKN